MELTEVIRRRRMVRGYDADRPVPPAVLTRALEHAVRAPSAGFAQGWDFIVLTAAADRERFWTAAAPVPTPGDPAAGDPAADLVADGAAGPDRWLSGMRTAPALILCLADPQRYLDRYAEPDKRGRAPGSSAEWPVPYWDVDVGMAALLMLLTAVDDGLGGCFFGVPGPRHAAVLSAFGAPPGRRIVGVVSLGYPGADRRSGSLRRGRRPLAEVAHFGRFGTPWPPGW